MSYKTIENLDMFMNYLDEKQIPSLWKEYTQFIRKPNLSFPNNITINITNMIGDEVKSLNYGSLIYLGDNKFEFNIEQAVVRQKFKPILYHEFTHIVDMIILNPYKNGDMKPFVKTCSTISEIRAEYVAYVINTGLKSITDSTILPDDTIVISEQNTIKEEILKNQKAILECLSSLNTYQKSDDTNINEQINNILKQVLYYIGFCLFISNHTNLTIDNDPILEKGSYIFGEDFYDFFDLSDNVPLSIDELDTDIALDYFEIFKDCFLYYRNHFCKDNRDKVVDAVVDLFSDFISKL